MLKDFYLLFLIVLISIIDKCEGFFKCCRGGDKFEKTVFPAKIFKPGIAAAWLRFFASNKSVLLNYPYKGQLGPCMAEAIKETTKNIMRIEGNGLKVKASLNAVGERLEMIEKNFRLKFKNVELLQEDLHENLIELVKRAFPKGFWFFKKKPTAKVPRKVHQILWLYHKIPTVNFVSVMALISKELLIILETGIQLKGTKLKELKNIYCDRFKEVYHLALERSSFEAAKNLVKPVLPPIYTTRKISQIPYQMADERSPEDRKIKAIENKIDRVMRLNSESWTRMHKFGLPGSYCTLTSIWDLISNGICSSQVMDTYLEMIIMNQRPKNGNFLLRRLPSDLSTELLANDKEVIKKTFNHYRILPGETPKLVLFPYKIQDAWTLSILILRCRDESQPIVFLTPQSNRQTDHVITSLIDAIHEFNDDGHQDVCFIDIQPPQYKEVESPNSAVFAFGLSRKFLDGQTNKLPLKLENSKLIRLQTAYHLLTGKIED